MEIQLKTTLRFHRMAIIKKMKNNRSWQGHWQGNKLLYPGYYVVNNMEAPQNTNIRVTI